MNRFALFAAVASFVAMPVWAQTLKMPAPGKAEARTAQKAPVKKIKPVYRHLTKRSRLDARGCLKYKTDEKVIICAEKFL